MAFESKRKLRKGRREKGRVGGGMREEGGSIREYLLYVTISPGTKQLVGNVATGVSSPQHTLYTAHSSHSLDKDALSYNIFPAKLFKSLSS